MKQAFQNYQPKKPERNWKEGWHVLADEIQKTLHVNNAYWLFWQFEEHLIREAFKTTVNQGKGFSYMLGILHKSRQESKNGPTRDIVEEMRIMYRAGDLAALQDAFLRHKAEIPEEAREGIVKAIHKLALQDDKLQEAMEILDGQLQI